MRKLFTLSILCLCLLTSAYAQSGKATGKVINARDGAPIVGASVNVKGISKRTQTDGNGLFSIDIPGSQAVLEITSVGFSTVSMTVSAGKMAEISMLLENKELSEVVVTGTGVATSKKKLAIAVESITADKLPAMPTADVGGALVGKIAGAQISSINGSPGAPVNILLRGINSINQGTTPMILVDGVQVNSGLERLDLAAYDRIEVVQGAAAASIFGAQGANGVIQLFTKRGKQGKVNIDVSSSVAVNELINVGNVNKAKKHAFAVNANGEVVDGAGAPLALDPATGSYLTNPVFNLINPASKYSNEYGKNLLWYDHYDMYFQQSTTINNSVSINGAKDKMDFNVIASDNRQSTVFKDNGDFSRTNLTVNLGAELMKGLRFRSITQLINTVNRQ
ncbi:MAG: TonB-dependent receptor plug domain-containing protein, partial [Chitinophagaceae bacterium]